MADETNRVHRAIMAWHASPYDFQKFGPMKEVSGTGQGAAVYGRGAAYVAESPKVSGPGESEYMKEFQHHDAVQGARRWQVKDDDGNWSDLIDDSFDEMSAPEALFEPRNDFGRDWVLSHLSNHDIQQDPGALDHLRGLIQKDRTDFEEATGVKHNADAFPNLARYMNDSSWRSENGDDYNARQHAVAVATYLATHADKELRHFSDQGAGGPFSYRVALHLRPENMLDWDMPLTDHHSEAAKKIEGLVRQHYPRPPGLGRLTDTEIRENSPGSTTYQRLVARLGSDFAASEALFNAGIHGIRYKDGASRNGPQFAVTLDGNELGLDTSKHEPHVVEALQSVGRAFNDNGGDIGLALNKLQQRITSADQLGGFEERRDHLLRAKKWLEANQHRIDAKLLQPTYNYVVFHPDFIEALQQYDIKGNLVKDFGPGAHLKAVDHDPFEGEDK